MYMCVRVSIFASVSSIFLLILELFRLCDNIFCFSFYANNSTLFLLPLTFLCLSQTRIWISNVICYSLFLCLVFSELRWEVIVPVVDIGGIVDHHCLEVIVCFVDIGRIVDHHCL